MALVSCRDRATEKRLADVESRLAKLEGSPSPVPALASAATVTPAETKPEGPLPVIEFDNNNHDFGTVPEGPKVSHTYQVKNTGQAPLIIQDVKPTCGCTTPDWTKTPIAVGESGFIKAVFDTKGRTGVQNKTISVVANTWPKTTTLKFKAMVTASSASNGPRK
ncbi:MAG: DUF1573 domain-containing protein [Bacteroidetes bacterium]|nr:DUF1573 domain-containing protein [Bacteroidota bacterium]